MAIGLEDLGKKRVVTKTKSFTIGSDAPSLKEERTQIRPWENAPEIKTTPEMGTARSYDAYQESKVIAQQNEAQASRLRERFEEAEVYGGVAASSVRFKTEAKSSQDADWSFATPFMSLPLRERLKRMMLTFFAD